ncbi:hypothetical protein CP09DC77_1031B, partial [Chlamydia psittaci 09DC77]
ISPPPPNFFF